MYKKAFFYPLSLNFTSQRYKNTSYTDVPDVLVYANDGAEIKAINAVADMQKNGINARFCVLETLEEAKAFAEKMGIDKVQIIG